ncbi:RYamide receptor-like [Ornithodoros turicata]|uniref:RYamide receptor-like n=1 Tax=Ornithodoros turicata TaxID=34597 RepID=UPI003139564F
MDRLVIFLGYINDTENDTWPTSNDTNFSRHHHGNVVDEPGFRHDDLYEVPLDVIIILSFCYGTVSLLSVVGNMMVLYIVASSRRMQTVTNYFIANLAVADIIIGAFAIPFQFQAALLQRWLLPNFMCPFCPYVQVLSVSVSIFTLVAIAVDRYRAVMSPLKARTCTKLNAKMLILLIWIVSCVAASPNAAALRVTMIRDGDTGNVDRPFCHNALWDPFAWKVYNHGLVCVQYFLPLIAVCYTYGKILRRLRRSRAPGNTEIVRDANILRNKRKVIKMMAVLVTTFAMCWLPYQSYNLLSDLYPEINTYRYINVIWFSCHWLAMSNSCYNPFIYAIYSEKFSAEFKSRVRCFLKRRLEDSAYFPTSMATQTSLRMHLSKERG